MVDPRGPPAVHVNAHQEQEQDEQQGAPVQTQHHLQLPKQLDESSMFF